MPFSTFLRLEGDHNCACAQKWCHFSYISKSFQTNKRIKALRSKMTKIASRGGGGLCLKIAIWSLPPTSNCQIYPQLCTFCFWPSFQGKPLIDEGPFSCSKYSKTHHVFRWTEECKLFKSLVSSGPRKWAKVLWRLPFLDWAIRE